MKIYVVIGYNGLLEAFGCVGVSKTPEGAQKILKENEFMLDKSSIQEMELTE